MNNPIPIHCAHTRIADAASLVPNPRNPNRHPESQIALLAKIIKHQGWRNPITVSKRSGFIVTGHGRLDAAKLLKLETVPVDDQEFATEADEWAHLLADNRLAELAETDGAVLKDVLLELDTGAFDMDLTGFDARELERVITYFRLDGENDPNAEWQGMPQCSSEDLTAWKAIRINFRNAEDLAAFAKLVGQTVTEQTRSIWYPRAAIGRYSDKQFIDESEVPGLHN